jgi:hypothetical protein
MHDSRIGANLAKKGRSLLIPVFISEAGLEVPSAFAFSSCCAEGIPMVHTIVIMQKQTSPK